MQVLLTVIYRKISIAARGWKFKGKKRSVEKMEVIIVILSTVALLHSKERIIHALNLSSEQSSISPLYQFAPWPRTKFTIISRYQCFPCELANNRLCRSTALPRKIDFAGKLDALCISSILISLKFMSFFFQTKGLEIQIIVNVVRYQVLGSIQ